MKIYEIILIGIVLALDAFSVTVANCTIYKKDLNKLKSLSMPFAFAIFQFIMPLIGFFIGSLVASYITEIAKYITAGVFFILGIKIIIDILKPKEEDVKENNFTFWLLIIQGLATSIDALVIGVTFAIRIVEFLPSLFASLIIGIITFIICLIALFIGKKLDKVFDKYAEWIGAIILIALAVKNLFF